jgi:hypothetical protein
VKRDQLNNQWMVVSEETAREKIGQLIREALAKKDPEKIKARKERRRRKAKEARLERQSTEQNPTTQDQLPQERLRRTENAESKCH